MYLQLAESPRRRGRVSVSQYRRAGTVSAHQRRYPQLSEAEANPYVYVPNLRTGRGVYIREDKFDNLSNGEWNDMMRTLAPYQPDVESGELSEPMFLASRASRKERRERKKEAKVQKKEAKAEKKKQKTENKKMKAESKAELRRAKGEAKKTKADAKKAKSEGGGGKGFDWDKAAEIGGKVVGKFTNKGEGGEEGGEGGGAGGSSSGTPFLKSTGGIITMSLLGLAVIGGVGYAITKK